METTTFITLREVQNCDLLRINPRATFQLKSRSVDVVPDIELPPLDPTFLWETRRSPPPDGAAAVIRAEADDDEDGAGGPEAAPTAYAFDEDFDDLDDFATLTAFDASGQKVERKRRGREERLFRSGVTLPRTPPAGAPAIALAPGSGPLPSSGSAAFAAAAQIPAIGEPLELAPSFDVPAELPLGEERTASGEVVPGREGAEFALAARADAAVSGAALDLVAREPGLRQKVFDSVGRKGYTLDAMKGFADALGLKAPRGGKSKVEYRDLLLAVLDKAGIP